MRSLNPANPQNSGGYTQEQVKALVAEKSKITLLWTNPDPSSAFAAQTITVDGLKDYDFLLIQNISINKWINALNIFSLERLKQGSTNISCGGAGGNVHFRDIKISDDGIVFGKGYYASGFGSDSEIGVNNNSAAVPLYIFGIKL